VITTGGLYIRYEPFETYHWEDNGPRANHGDLLLRSMLIGGARYLTNASIPAFTRVSTSSPAFPNLKELLISRNVPL
jgi:hypothetical protein